MQGLSIVNEIVKTYDAKLESEQGFINIDLGVYYPYLDQEVVAAEVQLYEELPYDLLETYNTPRSKGIHGHVMNHRYTNMHYVTLSKKSSNHICNTGTFIVDTIKNLNKLKYLFIATRIREREFMYIVPVSINLTTDKPCTTIEIHELHTMNEGLTLCTRDWKNNRWYDSIYCTDISGYKVCKKQLLMDVNLLGMMRIVKGDKLQQIGNEPIILPAVTFENIVIS